MTTDAKQQQNNEQKEIQITVKKQHLSQEDQKFNRDLRIKQYRITNELNKMQFQIEDLEEELQKKYESVKVLQNGAKQVYSDNIEPHQKIKECNMNISTYNQQLDKIKQQRNEVQRKIDKQRELFKGFDPDNVDTQIQQLNYEIDHSNLSAQEEKNIRKKIERLQEASKQTIDYKANQMQKKKYNEQMDEIYQKLKEQYAIKEEQKNKLIQFAESVQLTEETEGINKIQKQIDEIKQQRKKLIEEREKLYVQFKK